MANVAALRRGIEDHRSQAEELHHQAEELHHEAEVHTTEADRLEATLALEPPRPSCWR
jgi:hypothetical protein